ATTIRLDDDVLDAFKATGRGWQTRVNAALKE
ncbi:BrnA antitoxin family protein, partial [Burkholderia pseudomallei]